jgi:hypothetical protein
MYRTALLHQTQEQIFSAHGFCDCTLNTEAKLSFMLHLHLCDIGVPFAQRSFCLWLVFIGDGLTDFLFLVCSFASCFLQQSGLQNSMQLLQSHSSSGLLDHVRYRRTWWPLHHDLFNSLPPTTYLPVFCFGVQIVGTGLLFIPYAHSAL